MKLKWRNCMSPFTFGNVTPESSLGSISGFRSRIVKMDAVAILALYEFDAKELD